MTNSRFLRIRVRLDEESEYNYYSGITVSAGDTVVVTTRHGTVKGTVSMVVGDIDYNPFEAGNAKQRVLENATQKILDKENVIMFGAKTVEVKHISSNRRGIFYTDLDLKAGQTVVYEEAMAKGGVVYNDSSPAKSKRFNDFPVDCDIDEETANDIAPASMHVGIVTNTDPDVVTANSWVVCLVDTTAHQERKAKMRKATKLLAKLDQKKKQFQDIELLRLIAASDPETKSMLDEYTGLIGGK